MTSAHRNRRLPRSAPPFDISGLFNNTPVRRKFLKRPSTEFGHIAEQFTRVALAHPRLHMTLTHNDRDVFALPPTDRLIERLELFYGRDVTETLIWVENEAGGCKLWGYVGHPSQTKSNRKGQYLFLNGRPISDRSLSHALTEAYRGLVMVGRQPIAFLFLEMPPGKWAHVNVHPTKAEVRFQDSQQHYRQLLSTIRSTFLGVPLETSLRVDASDQHQAGEAGGPHQQRLAIAPARGGTTPTPWSGSATAASDSPTYPQPTSPAPASPTVPTAEGNRGLRRRNPQPPAVESEASRSTTVTWSSKHPTGWRSSINTRCTNECFTSTSSNGCLTRRSSDRNCWSPNRSNCRPARPPC
ncbi:MAG: hypothetical protein Ct9H300mP1_18010 [Planctomycetaceae bacterium]|nr:MAG: hypothetical protein Ct9H300mP1_18010 [Planctomycetaceae bacterium]